MRPIHGETRSMCTSLSLYTEVVYVPRPLRILSFVTIRDRCSPLIPCFTGPRFRWQNVSVLTKVFLACAYRFARRGTTGERPSLAIPLPRWQLKSIGKSRVKILRTIFLFFFFFVKEIFIITSLEWHYKILYLTAVWKWRKLWTCNLKRTVLAEMNFSFKFRW